MADIKDQPKVVLIISGKRKSGKDFIANKLKDIFGHDMCDIIRLSGPLKYEYARQNRLDFDRLLDSSTYKELHRQDMIRWGEEKRDADPAYFCRLAVHMTISGANPGVKPVGDLEDTRPIKPVWIISDARRTSDLKYFKASYNTVITVRVNASEVIRNSRGWVFTPGVDDAESECGLDGEEFDIVIQNDGNEKEFVNCINSLQSYVHKFLTL